MEAIMNNTKRFNPDSISDQCLLDELLKLSKKLGKTPSRSDMLKRGTGITKRLYLYGRRFGGLTEACEKAGLITNKGGSDLKYTDEELLNHILDLQKSLSRTPTQQDINTAGKYAIGAYKRHFGTYNKALEKLNIKYNMKFDISEKTIIDDILRISNILNMAPTVSEFDKLSSTVSHMTVYAKLNCGLSWNSVLKKCGHKVVNNRNITDDEFKEEIEKLKTQPNRIPGYYDMLQLGCYSPETYAERFGSYLLSLKHFGYDYTPDSQWQNQTYTRGNDGILYRSKFEANIGNVLFDLKNAGIIASYEYEKQVCSDRKWTCDFYIIKNNKEMWLEADGMGKNRYSPYDIDNEKIEFYNNNGYRYIIVPYKKIDLLKYISNIIT